MVGASDEALIGTGSVEVRAPDRVGGLVAPVDVLAVDGDSERVAGTGDEALVDRCSIDVGLRDRSVAAICPVDVMAPDG